jgi:hypothetical protein
VRVRGCCREKSWLTKGCAIWQEIASATPPCSLLIAGPRLRRLGVRVPERPTSQPWEHLLYERLEQRLCSAAHSHYNSLIRRVVSYARALEREKSKS